MFFFILNKALKNIGINNFIKLVLVINVIPVNFTILADLTPILT